MQDRLRKISGSSAILTAVVVMGVLLWMLTGLSRCTHKEEEKAPQQPPLFEVTVQKIENQKKKIPIVLSGVTKAARSTKIAAETKGTIEKILVKKGVEVEEGTVLAKIAPATRLMQLSEARAIKKQYGLDKHAQERLFKEGFASQTALSRAQAAFETAEVKEAAILQDFKYTEIQAPFKGIISKKYIDKGSYVDPGKTLFKFVQMHPLLVKTWVSDKDFPSIQEGEEAVISLQTGQLLKGKVTFKGFVAQEKTHVFPVDITVSNKDLTAPVGAACEVTLFLEGREVMALPPQALILLPDGKVAVRVVTTKDMVEEMPVKIVTSFPDSVWVEGLPSPSFVIIRGQDFVKKGEQVKPVELKENDISSNVSSTKAG